MGLSNQADFGIRLGRFKENIKNVELHPRICTVLGIAFLAECQILACGVHNERTNTTPVYPEQILFSHGWQG